MKVEHLKKLPALFLSLFLLVGSTSPVFAARPYFKTYGSDVMTGGWFENNSTCDTSTYYQNPDFVSGSGKDNRTGGILAFANDTGNSGKSSGGASSQYAAYSLGLIESDFKQDWGFYTDGANIGGSIRADDLAFANKNPALPASAWGGMFEGTTKQSHCIPDYYSQRSGAAAVSSATTLNGLATGNYSITAAGGTNYSLTAGDVTIPAGTKINIYVNGNVYIGNNIFYGSSNADDVPKLRIVAKGSIFIDPSVQQIDGWYVAQPDMSLNAAAILSGDTGVIATCHPDTIGNPKDTYIMANCGSKLTVNGALVAKHYDLTRLNGNVKSATTAEDTLAPSGSGNIAEVIHFTPAMLIGGGFTGGSGGSGPLPIDSLLSLPPVF
jgi:hypothetical protein